VGLGEGFPEGTFVGYKKDMRTVSWLRITWLVEERNGKWALALTFEVGTVDGLAEGFLLGEIDGCLLGTADGCLLGEIVGLSIGEVVGL